MKRARWESPLAAIESLELRTLLSAPQFIPSTYSFNVAEDAASGAIVGILTATDPQDDIMSYDIVDGDPLADFFVDVDVNSDGELTVQGTLDFETTPTYILTVEVQDMMGNTNTATVTVNVSNVSEPPEFTPDVYTFDISEGAPVGEFVGSVWASNPIPASLSYSIVAGNIGSAFTVDEFGDIAVNDALDFETTPTYTLTVEADNGDGTDTATVTVNVTDIVISVEEAIGWGWEGSDLFFNFIATTDTGEITTFEVDIDSDGTFDVSTDIDTMLDGNGLDDVPLMGLLGAPVEQGSYAAVVRITTDSGETTDFNFSIDVENTPPDVHLESPSTSLPVAGVSHTWNIEIDDPGPDTISSITIDWGDGSSTTVAGTASSVSHTYLADGDYPAEITVVDEDDTYVYGGLTMTVGPVAAAPNPEPLYDYLIDKIKKKIVKQAAHAITLRTIRTDWTTHQVAEGIIKLNATGAAAFGLDLAEISRWETRETTRMGKLGYDVTFTTKAFLKYYITGGIPAPGGGTTGEVNFRFHVYTKATVTNRATGAVTTTIKKIWSSGNNTGKDKTYSAAVNPDPSPETLPTTPAQFDAGY